MYVCVCRIPIYERVWVDLYKYESSGFCAATTRVCESIFHWMFVYSLYIYTHLCDIVLQVVTILLYPNPPGDFNLDTTAVLSPVVCSFKCTICESKYYYWHIFFSFVVYSNHYIKINSIIYSTRIEYKNIKYLSI